MISTRHLPRRVRGAAVVAALIAFLATGAAAAPPEAPEPAARPTLAPEAPDPGAGEADADMASFADLAEDAVAARTASDADWNQSARAAVAARLALRRNTNQARNVVVMIGGGFGPGARHAARLFAGQTLGGAGDGVVLAPDALPYLAHLKTYAVDRQAPDDAAAATALFSGVKTRVGVVGRDAAARRGVCGSGAPVPSLGDLFVADGRAVGLVTTSRVTQATAAALYARLADRSWEDDGAVPADCATADAALQLAGRVRGGDLDVVMGGGRSRFFPAAEGITDQEGAPGRRRDGRNLLREARADGVRTVWNAETLDALDLTAPEPIIGLFASGPMLYEHDRRTLNADEPSLTEMTEAALTALSARDDGAGFLLVIEAGRIGQAAQYGNLHRVAVEGAAFAAAVARVSALTDPADTLLIVAADYASAIGFNGACARGSAPAGLCLSPEGGPALAADGKPFETAVFLSGPGAPVLGGPRPRLAPEAALEPNHRQQSLTPLAAGAHAPIDVAAQARGPWAHLVTGVMEQHVLHHIIRHAAGL